MLQACYTRKAIALSSHVCKLCDAPFLARCFFNSQLDSNTALKCESFYDSTVEKYAQQPLEVLKLHQILNFGKDAWKDTDKILKSARHVQRELPKRLARRLLDLQLLPYIVVSNPHIKRVYQSYYNAFETLRRLPPVTSLEENNTFTALLRRMLDEHAPMLDYLAAGLRECRSKEVVGACLALDTFLDNMLRSRISRRVIAEQHLHINNRRPGYIGIVCTDLDVQDAVEFAAQRTMQVCTETYGVSPQVKVSGDLYTRLPYIPAHLDYILYEILKNAMRAVVEHHRQQQRSHHHHHHHHVPLNGSLPPVLVRICKGSQDLTLRISDQGGGIPDDQLDKVWSYGYTTIRAGNGSAGTSSSSSSSSSSSGRTQDDSSSPHSWYGSAAAPPGSDSSVGGVMDSSDGSSSSSSWTEAGSGPAAAGRFRMAGLGFGLPLSKLYARYFGGDLRLQVIPGYGCDVYVTLRQLEDRDWQEVVEEQPHLMPFKVPY